MRYWTQRATREATGLQGIEARCRGMSSLDYDIQRGIEIMGSSPNTPMTPVSARKLTAVRIPQTSTSVNNSRSKPQML